MVHGPQFSESCRWMSVQIHGGTRVRTCVHTHAHKHTTISNIIIAFLTPIFHHFHHHTHHRFHHHSHPRIHRTLGILAMVHNLTSVSVSLTAVSGDLQCEPIRSFWFKFLNTGTYLLSFFYYFLLFFIIFIFLYYFLLFFFIMLFINIL